MTIAKTDLAKRKIKLIWFFKYPVLFKHLTLHVYIDIHYIKLSYKIAHALRYNKRVGKAHVMMDFSTVSDNTKDTRIDLSKNISSDPKPGMTNTEHVIWRFLFVIVNVASLLGNSIVMYVILKKNQFRNKKFAFLFLLLISDFIIATVAMPLYTVNFFMAKFFEASSHVCVLMAILFTIITMFSCLCITVLTIERYIMLKYPIKHRLWFTKVMVKRIVFAVLLISVIGTVIQVLMSTPVTYNERLHLCCFDKRGANEQETRKNIVIEFLSLGLFHFIFLYCSVGVLVVIWKRQNSLKQINPEVPVHSAISTNRRVTLNIHSCEISSSLRVIFVAFIVFAGNLPLSISYACSVLGCNWSERSIVASVFIFYCKSALNPLINAFLYSQLRHYLVKLLCCKL